MSNSPKFMVFHLKELIYTLVFILLGIFLIVMLVFMFKDKGNETTETSGYVSGVYTSGVKLNDASMEIKVVVDEEHINSVTIENADESIATMYPLVKPAFEDIASQIVTTQSLDNIKYSEGSQYTYTLLLNAIEKTLEKASPKK